MQLICLWAITNEQFNAKMPRCFKNFFVSLYLDLLGQITLLLIYDYYYLFWLLFKNSCAICDRSARYFSDNWPEKPLILRIFSRLHLFGRLFPQTNQPLGISRSHSTELQQVFCWCNMKIYWEHNGNWYIYVHRKDAECFLIWYGLYIQITKIGFYYLKVYI